jgi:hypothetical protein
MASEQKGGPEHQPFDRRDDSRRQTTGKSTTFTPTPSCELRKFQVGTVLFSLSSGATTVILSEKIGHSDIGKSLIFGLGALTGSVFCLLLLASLYDKICKRQPRSTTTSSTYYHELEDTTQSV